MAEASVRVLQVHPRAGSRVVVLELRACRLGCVAVLEGGGLHLMSFYLLPFCLPSITMPSPTVPPCSKIFEHGCLDQQGK